MRFSTSQVLAILVAFSITASAGQVNALPMDLDTRDVRIAAKEAGTVFEGGDLTSQIIPAAIHERGHGEHEEKGHWGHKRVTGESDHMGMVLLLLGMYLHCSRREQS